jgi:hypothetical protein
VKRVAYFALAAVVALLILAPSALAQDVLPGDDHPLLPEPNAEVVGSHEELERLVGRPVPSQGPGEPPLHVGPDSPTQGLPKSGGPSVSAIVPAAALLLVGSGVLGYALLRRGREGRR